MKLAALVATTLLFAAPLSARLLGNDGFVQGYAVLGGTAYFVGRSEGQPTANIWKTDGTAAGTQRVTSFGTAETAQSVYAVNGKLLAFVEWNGVLVLAESDGTPAGTDHLMTLGSKIVLQAAVQEDALYFFLYSTGPTAELWRSDGTAEGTHFVHTFSTAPPLTLAPAGKNLFVFSGGSELWATDGTVEGTRVVHQAVFRLRPQSVLLALGDVLIFDAFHELWRSDGTVAGTYQVYPYVSTADAVVFKGQAYIAAHADGLLRTDGTAAGTVTVRKYEFLLPTHRLAVSDSRLYDFSDKEIWSTDGTDGGRSIAPPERAFPDFEPQLTTAAGDSMLFTTRSSLWKTDGTAEGTTQVTALDGVDPRFATSITRLGGKVLLAMTSMFGREPWVFDGTAAGSGMLLNVFRETTLHARVIDRDTGRPVAGAVVEVSTPGEPESGECKTGEDGRCDVAGLRSGNMTASARGSRAFGSAPFTFEAVPGEDVEHEFTVVGGFTLRGRVVDGDGRPVSGIGVGVSPDRYRGTESVRTAEDGTFSIGLLEPNRFWLVYTTDDAGYSGVVYNGVSCAAGCDAHTQGLRVTGLSGDLVQVELVVRRWGRIRGQVLDSVTGEPISVGVTVTARNPAGLQTAIGVRNGFFELPLRDGRNIVSATSAAGLYLPATLREPAIATPGRTTSGYDIVMTPTGGRFRGRVTNANGAPVAGVILRVLDASEKQVAITSSTGDGSYSTLPQFAPGAYTIRTDPASAYGAVTVAATITGTKVTIADIRLPAAGGIHGQVVDWITGEPLPGVRIELSMPDGTRVGPRIETGADGRYTTPFSEPGTYVATATRPGWRPAPSAHFTIANRESSVKADFTLAPACANTSDSPVIDVPAAGGAVTLDIRSNCMHCAFTAAPFLRIPDACSAAGPLRIEVAANDAAPREGKIVLPGLVITIRQGGQ